MLSVECWTKGSHWLCAVWLRKLWRTLLETACLKSPIFRMCPPWVRRHEVAEVRRGSLDRVFSLNQASDSLDW